MSGTGVASSVKQLLRNPWLRRIIQWVIIVVPLAYVASSVIDNWQSLSAYRQQFDVRWLVGTVACWIVTRLLLTLSSQQVFLGLGHSLTARATFRAFHLSAPSAFLPGGLHFGRPVVFGEYGVDVVSTSASVIIEQSSWALLDALGSIPYLLFVRTEAWTRYWPLGLAVICFMLLSVHPGIVNPVVRWLLKRAGYADRGVNFTFGHLARIMFLQSVAWLVSATGGYALVRSVYPAPLDLAPLLASAHSLANLASNVLALTPAGLGVMEGASTYLSSALLPAPVPAVLSILGRLMYTVVLLLMFAAAGAMGRTLQKPQPVVEGGASSQEQH